MRSDTGLLNFVDLTILTNNYQPILVLKTLYHVLNIGIKKIVQTYHVIHSNLDTSAMN